MVVSKHCSLRCHSMYYCSPDHQKKHWKHHRTLCTHLSAAAKVLEGLLTSGFLSLDRAEALFAGLISPDRPQIKRLSSVELPAVTARNGTCSEEMRYGPQGFCWPGIWTSRNRCCDFSYLIMLFLCCLRR